MGIREVLEKIADSAEIEQNAKIEPKPAQAATPVTVVTNGEIASVSSQNVDIQKPSLVITPVTEEREAARRLADNPLTGNGVQGVTAADVLRVFGGGLVIEEDKPLSCRHCNEKKGVPHWRKGGKIIRRIRADGVHVWACHFCGREVKRLEK